MTKQSKAQEFNNIIMNKINQKINERLNKFYPVGSIYITMSSDNPASLFSGKWIKLKDTFLLAAGDNYTADDLSNTTAQHGEATHQLTQSEMPSHSHQRIIKSESGWHVDGQDSGNLSYVGSYTWEANNVDVSHVPHTTWTGGNQAHNNMPPYLAVNIWRRKADAETTEELINVLTNVQSGDVIYIARGTYTLDQQYTIPPCTIIGEGKGKTIIQDFGFNFTTNSGNTIDISGITFDARDKSISNRDFIILGNGGNAKIHNCIFTNMGNAKWNSTNIRISNTSASSNIEIYDCEFTGTNNVTAFGHTNAAIGAYQLANAYNVYIHNNTFNHPSGGYSPLRNAKAIAFLNNYSTCTLHNCVAENNQYLGAGDNNYGISKT